MAESNGQGQGLGLGLVMGQGLGQGVGQGLGLGQGLHGRCSGLELNSSSTSSVEVDQSDQRLIGNRNENGNGTGNGRNEGIDRCSSSGIFDPFQRFDDFYAIGPSSQHRAAPIISINQNQNLNQYHSQNLSQNRSLIHRGNHDQNRDLIHLNQNHNNNHDNEYIVNNSRDYPNSLPSNWAYDYFQGEMSQKNGIGIGIGIGLQNCSSESAIDDVVHGDNNGGTMNTNM